MTRNRTMADRDCKTASSGKVMSGISLQRKKSGLQRLSPHREWGGLCRLTLLLLFLGSPVLLDAANPTGEQVVFGAISFDRTVPGVLTISQGSDLAIINWQDFSIGAGNLTRFAQSGANAAALNRVIGGNPSSIYGQLQANGQIFLINPAGILVGASGVIDTKGLVASTLDLSNESFLRNGHQQEHPSSSSITRWGDTPWSWREHHDQFTDQRSAQFIDRERWNRDSGRRD